GKVDSNTATVSITIVDTNNTPEASDATVTTNASQPIDIQLSATDKDNDKLTFSITAPPLNGRLSDINQEKHMVTYTPRPGFASSDSFMYKVNDGKVDSNTALVTIAVNPIQQQEGPEQTPISPIPTTNDTSTSSPPSTTSSLDDELSKLDALRGQGIISDEELMQRKWDTVLARTWGDTVTTTSTGAGSINPLDIYILGKKVDGSQLPKPLQDLLQKCRQAFDHLENAYHGHPIPSLEDNRNAYYNAFYKEFVRLGFSHEVASQKASVALEFYFKNGMQLFAEAFNQILLEHISYQLGVKVAESVVGKVSAGKLRNICTPGATTALEKNTVQRLTENLIDKGIDDVKNKLKFKLGEIKSIASYSKGLLQLAGRGDVDGNTALVLYDEVGDVFMQVFAKNSKGAREIVWEGPIGKVTDLPEVPYGTGPFGNAMEPKVKEIVEKYTGLEFKPKAPNAGGADLVLNEISKN
ncbi:MAG: Ig-like domain-containing protein, partial [Thermoproteota archaeon]|nr:Ig-like domain-containing protein [Thermoproteota archaeon]